MMKKSESENSKRSRMLFAAGLFLVILAVFELAGIQTEKLQEETAYEKMMQAAAEDQTKTHAKTRGKDKTSSDKTFDYREWNIDFEALQSINEDIIGWIRFDYNGINYPILKGNDNEEYLDTLPDGTKNLAGRIFMDSLCASDFTDFHTILYGHNMKNLTMFGKLKLYRMKQGYYEQNKYFTIYLPDAVCRYEIFAWYEVQNEDSVYQVGFQDREAFDTFVEQMIQRRYRDTSVAADGEDTIVTLSTCSVKGKRFVVHGKLVG